MEDRRRRTRLGLSLRQLAVLALGAAAVVFAWINAQPTEIELLVTRVRIPTSLVILLPLLLGFLLGWVEGHRRRRSDGEREGRPAGDGRLEDGWNGESEPTPEGGAPAGEGDAAGGQFVP